MTLHGKIFAALLKPSDVGERLLYNRRFLRGFKKMKAMKNLQPFSTEEKKMCIKYI
jgi:hypothetical protein